MGRKVPIMNMEKCKSCRECDKERSNENWVVCPEMPLSVMMSGSSEDCEKYLVGEE